MIAMRNPFEVRKAYLPDFSKAQGADLQGSAGGGRRRLHALIGDSWQRRLSRSNRHIYVRELGDDNVAVSNLSRRKMRSFLTMLGMIFGVGAVIAMLSDGAACSGKACGSSRTSASANIIQAKEFKAGRS